MADRRAKQRSPPSPPVTPFLDAEKEKEDDSLALAFTNSFEELDLRFPPSPSSPVVPYDITKPPRQDDDWKDFHARLRKCRDNTSGVEKIRFLLEKAQDHTKLANVRGYCQRVPLHIAAQLGFGQVARVLLDFGADIDAKDEKHFSVLDHAVEKNQREFVAILLENGVDEMGINRGNIAHFKDMKKVIKFMDQRRQ